jgi:arginase
MLPNNHKKYPCERTDFEINSLAAPYAHLHQPHSVAESSRRVYGRTREAASDSSFVLVLGGDHSVAIGSVAGVASVHPNIAVIWFDAHADINSALSSESGKIHGCPVSFLLGHQDSLGVPPFDWLRSELENHQKSTGMPAFLSPDRIAFIGLRSVDPPEIITLEKENIHTAYMTDLRKKGIDACLDEILQAINPDGARYIHLSFDIDGIDPEYTPSTGTPVPGGLSLDEALHIVRRIRATGRLFSMDIVELNALIGSQEDSAKTIQSTLQVIKAAISQD